MRALNEALENYMTVQEAAEELGIKEGTVRTYLTTGRIQGNKIFNTTVIHKDEIKRYNEQTK